MTVGEEEGDTQEYLSEVDGGIDPEDGSTLLWQVGENKELPHPWDFQLMNRWMKKDTLQDLI